MKDEPWRRVLSRAVLAVAAVLQGCGDPGVNPSRQDARAALEAALSSWKSGKTPADLATSSPPINVVDGEWAAGRKLADFEILREEPSAADKRFAVKLVRTPPAKDEEVVYIVLGAETVSVFRAEDYDRTMNMDNNPAPKKRR
ncbi:hypothetical protein [Paludisphaera soli]|uniref:hypothetical protein n=1 Tax=Paludisphaera soli TaxID=2712865 RepID=UPI0013ED6266|nr:hypothetical protein [Paludisphaera soli]